MNPSRNDDEGGSMLRLLKFYRRGYTAPLSTVADVMARMASKIDSTQLGVGLDIGTVLLGMLIEVDPLRANNEAQTGE